MPTQVFATEQEAVNYANSPEFAIFCLVQWGLSSAHAEAVADRLLYDATLSESDVDWELRLREARASFVRMAKP